MIQMEHIGQILEIAMIVAFGLSWPNNIITTLRNKSTKGKSLIFLILIDTGYVCGILGKILIVKVCQIAGCVAASPSVSIIILSNRFSTSFVPFMKIARI